MYIRMKSEPFNQIIKPEIISYGPIVMSLNHLWENAYDTTSPNIHKLGMETRVMSWRDQITQAKHHSCRFKDQVIKLQIVKQSKSGSLESAKVKANVKPIITGERHRLHTRRDDVTSTGDVLFAI